MLWLYDAAIDVLIAIKWVVGKAQDAAEWLYWRIDGGIDWLFERAVTSAQRREPRRGR